MSHRWFSVALLVASVILGSLLAPPASASVAPAIQPAANHAAILIDGDAGFTAANGVTGGSGTAADPYRIEGWTIDATQYIGLAVQNTRAHFVVRGITVNNGPTMGLAIWLSNVSHARVENSLFLGNLSGIQVWSGFGGVPEAVDDLAIVNNTFDVSWTEAITIAASNSTVSGNVIRMERFVSQGTYGLYALGRNLTVRNNRIVSPGYGMLVACTQGATVRGNVVSSALWALDLWQSGGVAVYGNDFLETGAGENLFENGVIDCGSFAPSGGNAWNTTYPFGGNFWSGYTGLDLCSGALQDVCTEGDGIGDSPFTLPSVQNPAVDRYPLMIPDHGRSLTYAYDLLGNATGGWGFSALSVSRPGPHLFAVFGAYAYLNLSASDDQSHEWFLDLNGNLAPDSNEPQSPVFVGSGVVLFVFTPLAVGSFTYRDAFYPATVWGNLTVLPAQGPSAFLTVTPSLGNVATVFTINASGSVNETGGVGGLSFRWDWTGDGLWDTGWGGEPIVTHVFSAGGWYAAVVQVRSTAGATDKYGVWVGVDDGTPVTHLAVNGTVGGAGWYRGPVTVCLSVGDLFGNAFAPMYRIDGTGWQEGTCFLLDSDGIHTIEYQTSDSTGHVEPLQSTVLKVDVTPPSLVIYPLDGPVHPGGATLRWNGLDRASGILSYSISIDQGDPISVGLATSFDLSLLEGNHTIRVLATDVAGNTGLAIESVTVVAAPSPLVPDLIIGMAAGGAAAIAGVAAFLEIQRRKRLRVPTERTRQPNPPSPPDNP